MFNIKETKDAKCFIKANQNDEPTFTLRAQDELAPYAILEWIRRATNAGVNAEKLVDARNDYKAFIEWQNKHPDSVKKPD